MHTYSSGMRIRLLFAVATSIAPDILLMDEWLSVADQSFQDKAEARMKELIKRAKIIVLATHNLTLVERTCNKVMCLDDGSISYFGDAPNLEKLTEIQSNKTLSPADTSNTNQSQINAPFDQEAIAWAYRMILGREPESMDVVRQMEEVGSIEKLRHAMLSSEEFLNSFNPPDPT
jgi:ABC-type multidrug transport system ATPase subunit